MTVNGIKVSNQSVLAYNQGIETFVNSLYRDCLGRTADASGLNDWCNKLTTGQITGKQCAYGFFFSPEFLGSENKYPDTDSLINVFYKVFLDRSADPQGMSYWKSMININMCFQEAVEILFTGFSDSAEFASKCSSFGINAGAHIDISASTASHPSVANARTPSVVSYEDILMMIWDDTSYYDYSPNSGFSRPAESAAALDAFWNSLGFQTCYIDLGNGVTKKCYAYFFDPAEHYNQLNAFRAQNGCAPLTVRYDKEDLARIRAVESSFNGRHDRPNGQSCFSIDPAMRSENITGFMAYQGFNDGHGNIVYGAVEAWARTTDGHRENMLAAHSGVAFASCAVVYVNDDGLTVETRGTWSEDERVVRIGTSSVQNFY